MKRRLYSEATGGDERIRKDPRIESRGFDEFNDSWASPELGSIPFSGLDAGPYTTSLVSPQPLSNASLLCQDCF